LKLPPRAGRNAGARDCNNKRSAAKAGKKKAGKKKAQKAQQKKAVVKKKEAAPELKTVPLVPARGGRRQQRQCPGQAKLNSEVVTRVTKGQMVTVLEEIVRNNSGPEEPSAWAKILLPPNAHVWVNSSFIDATNKTARPKRLNLRSGPGENYSVIGLLERGEAVKELKTKAIGWKLNRRRAPMLSWRHSISNRKRPRWLLRPQLPSRRPRRRGGRYACHGCRPSPNAPSRTAAGPGRGRGCSRRRAATAAVPTTTPPAQTPVVPAQLERPW